MAASPSPPPPPPPLLLLLLLLLPPSSLLASLLAFASPPADLVAFLPGQPSVDFKQYAGYVTVDEHTGRRLFYYFVEAQRNASAMPVTLWLNGGPGCSSIGGGAFTELGPFYPNGRGDGLVLNPYSWNKVSNVLFLETPAGVGFSYSNMSTDYDSDDSKVATDNLAFLLGWLEKFPEFKASDLYLTGESYAGHYIPQLAALILNHNKAVATLKLNLKGIAIGNPLLNYGLDTDATYSFLWSHGLISDPTFQGIKSSCDFSNGFPSRSDDETHEGCSYFVTRAKGEVGGNINVYDVTLDVCMPAIVRQQLILQNMMSLQINEVDVCIDDEIGSYLNLPQVQVALHANTTGLPYRWEACSRIINYVFSDQLEDMLPVLTSLLEQGLRTWIFSGDQDSVVPLTSTRTQMETIASRLKLTTSVPYSAWYTGGQVGGWTQRYGSLTYATVRGAAHMVPYAEPERALVLFNAFLSGSSLPQSQQ